MRPKMSLAQVKMRATNQAHINRLSHSEGLDAAMAELRNMAQVDLSDPSACSGPGWILAEASAVVESRGLVFAKPGDFVLVNQDIAGVVSFYSVRVGHFVVVGAGIKPLIGWDEAFAFWRDLQGKPEATWITAPEEEDDVVEVEPWLPPGEDKKETDDRSL